MPATKPNHQRIYCLVCISNIVSPHSTLSYCLSSPKPNRAEPCSLKPFAAENDGKRAMTCRAVGWAGIDSLGDERRNARQSSTPSHSDLAIPIFSGSLCVSGSWRRIHYSSLAVAMVRSVTWSNRQGSSSGLPALGTSGNSWVEFRVGDHWHNSDVQMFLLAS